MGSVDILAIAKQAQKAKQLDQSVIDATIGMFYDDEGLLVIPQVAEVFKGLDTFEVFKYGAVDGGLIFEKNALHWVLDDKYSKLEKHFKLAALSTPGGSGALSAVFGAYGKPGDKVLVSDLRWRYDFFIKSAKMAVHQHQLFDGDVFNLKDFEKQLEILTQQQHRVIVVINDPCHNPTGYQLSTLEWKAIIGILNRFEQNEIILTYDLAYFDYDPQGFKEARETFEYLIELKDHVQTLICFSASKSFAIYGVRLGAAIGLFKKEQQYRFFKKHVLDDALGKWSTAPSVGVAIFNEITKDKQKKRYIPYLNKLTKTLKMRGDIFLKEAKEVGLDIYPYRGGFFVLIKSNQTEADFFKLIEQENIYLIPMKEGLRLALCGITTSEVKDIAFKIKKVISQ